MTRHLSAEPELVDEAGSPAEVDAGPGDDAGATITPYRDGPLIVRGDFRLVDQDGVEIDPGRATIALCRCGKSGIKPFCDGAHKRSGFSAPSAPSRPRPAAQLQRETRRSED
ncbi:CDGSH-type Zn-finger protein [Blastococcus colisei]|uniref:CDGSH-type Zn-finger protein n=1 Tax=Blastococcus colisei TaxID=1564162 RepID=A0A543PHK6_9ACTN|nr:CDGSH iron-sulfur domain-containing protein [Blastococcus colisei]TQN43566.1 CDGSH-type Zn-finger protein [Blastococcus colisei]